MELHKLLQRQLTKLELGYNALPKKLENWQGLIEHINNAYRENDQERYLLERSMDISSREMLGINERLEYAQHLATLCYWHYKPSANLLSWSKGIYDLLELDPLNPAPLYKDFLELIHPANRAEIEKRIAEALMKRTDIDTEIRIKTANSGYKWFRLLVKPSNMEQELLGIMKDINTRKESEIKIAELNSALLNSARLAGMSEVATTILHNIGNILNTINVSVVVLKENLSQNQHKKLPIIVNMMKENIHHLDDYLTSDSKGKLILPYLAKIVEANENESLINNRELLLLEKKLNHIKEIVAMQQVLSGVTGVYQQINIEELLNNAVEISGIQQAKIVLKKKTTCKIKTITSDRSKILQILINLLRNAKDSVLENSTNKTNKVSLLVKPEKDTVKIIVKDNGVGVAPEGLNRIFSLGFTTKPGGHGFGLHSSAISARELGGSLKVQSLGVNQGAEFILLLPVRQPKKVKESS